jgi:hypothetical protein
MNRLAVRDEGTLDAGEQDYLDTLVMLVESYDAKNGPIDSSQVSPLELLKGLMENRSEKGVISLFRKRLMTPFS